MSNILKEKLQTHFGFTDFRKGQREAIELALTGSNSLVMLPTGSGKSLCYQMVAYLKPGIVVIVSPLLSLMQDQVERIKQRGDSRVCMINSLIPKKQIRQYLNNLSKFRFVYLSPEMLNQPTVIQALRNVNISLFAVDEAHCISQWGLDFRPDYLNLKQLRNQLNKPTTMALTATATSEVKNDIQSYLFDTNEEVKSLDYPINRPEIKYFVEKMGTYDEKIKRLIDITSYIQKPGIVYFSSKKIAQEVAYELQQALKVKIGVYHSEIDRVDKERIQTQFLNNKLQIICATSAFGMGVDKSDIRFVIHFHLPSSLEMYLQETGRASRDGEDGVAILLYSKGDERLQYLLKSDSLPTEKEIEEIYFSKNPTYLTPEHVQLINVLQNENLTLKEIQAVVLSAKSAQDYQLRQVVEYIYSKKCLRNKVLNYFDNEYIKQTPCCSNCNPEIMGYFEEQIPVKMDAESAPKDAKEILQQLFNLDENNSLF